MQRAADIKTVTEYPYIYHGEATHYGFESSISRETGCYRESDSGEVDIYKQRQVRRKC